MHMRRSNGRAKEIKHFVELILDICSAKLVLVLECWLVVWKQYEY